MKERPILFSAPMVRAIQAGQKMQTRRIVKLPRGRDSFVMLDHGNGWWPYQSDDGETALCDDGCEHPYPSPYGMPGDPLWVKETWQYYDWNEEGEPCIRYAADNTTGWPNPSQKDWAGRLVDVWEELSRADNYKIDGRARDRKWRPSIFMPRWASRILLEVVSVRVEPLNDISEADAIAEGVQSIGGGRYWLGADGLTPRGSATAAYRDLWISINGADSWNANPWVWVVEFKQIESQKGMK